MRHYILPIRLQQSPWVFPWPSSSSSLAVPWEQGVQVIAPSLQATSRGAAERTALGGLLGKRLGSEGEDRVDLQRVDLQLGLTMKAAFLI